MAYLVRFQSEPGSLRGPYDGPLFLTPGYVFAHYATGTRIPDDVREKLVQSIERTQNTDGGFGLHAWGPSLLFTTVLNYIALRLLGGTSPRALAWIQQRGGAVAIPSWGKYWLAVLRLYDWDGVNPLQPELLLLPRWFPAHPSRLWCHARVIYLPLSYLYGRRWQAADDELLRTIRTEIFVGEPDWRRSRTLVDTGDVYTPHRLALRALNAVLVRVERLIPRRLRARALGRIVEQVEHEELTTSFVALGPVNKALDAIVLHAAASSLARRAIEGLRQYLYDGPRGLSMQAYNSSELWDTAFAAQALAEAGETEAFRHFATRARVFLLASQVREDVPERERHHRDPSRGGWPFSNLAHGWPIADCTAEGLQAALALGPVERERITQAVDLLLYWQNRDGGWPTYERRRGTVLLELFNASELFADIMVDYSYVELTAAALGGLVAARTSLDGYRSDEIARAVARGARFLRRRQRFDGSWEGAWGICFTYGTWFGIRGLRAAGVATGDPAVRRAAGFLLSKQLPDGGWGESWESCPRREYVQHPGGSQPVMTAWALLALLEASAERQPVERGVAFLLRSQRNEGDWPQQGPTGVFNRTCMLDYGFYRQTFPIWALALAERLGYVHASTTRDRAPGSISAPAPSG